ncbi:GNAT family acetyltransferase [Klebsiella pneumoniae]|nr:GNAT family acetyltransferase [Klebsiella pneumoniae]
MTAYNRRFGKAPRHDFDVHRPLETDDDLTAFFTWREPRRVSKSLTVQYDKVLYLIEDNELSRRAIGKYIEVWHYPDGRKELRLNGMVMNRWLDHWQTHSFGNWAISLLTNPEKIIGFGGLGIRNYDDIVINNLGYRLSTEAWGKGLATEFAIYAIKFGFDVIKLTEISAVVRENHLASQKVLQKSGLRYVKEIHDVKDAPPSLLYSISVDEWLRNLEVNASV